MSFFFFLLPVSSNSSSTWDFMLTTSSDQKKKKYRRNNTKNQLNEFLLTFRCLCLRIALTKYHFNPYISKMVFSGKMHINHLPFRLLRFSSLTHMLKFIYEHNSHQINRNKIKKQRTHTENEIEYSIEIISPWIFLYESKTLNYHAYVYITARFIIWLWLHPLLLCSKLNFSLFFRNPIDFTELDTWNVSLIWI